MPIYNPLTFDHAKNIDLGDRAFGSLVDRNRLRTYEQNMIIRLIEILNFQRRDSSASTSQPVRDL